MIKNRSNSNKPTVEDMNASHWLKENKKIHETIEIEMNSPNYESSDIKLGDHLKHINLS
jgi:hypothetical protein